MNIVYIKLKFTLMKWIKRSLKMKKKLVYHLRWIDFTTGIFLENDEASKVAYEVLSNLDKQNKLQILYKKELINSQ
jgi:hypothetical protein